MTQDIHISLAHRYPASQSHRVQTAIPQAVKHKARQAKQLLPHLSLGQVEAIVGGNLSVTNDGVFVRGVKLTDEQLADLLPRLQSLPEVEHPGKLERATSWLQNISTGALTQAIRDMFAVGFVRITQYPQDPRRGTVVEVRHSGGLRYLEPDEVIALYDAHAGKISKGG